MAEYEEQAFGQWLFNNFELKRWLHRAGSNRRQLLNKLKDDLRDLGLPKRVVCQALLQLTIKPYVVLDRLVPDLSRMKESLYQGKESHNLQGNISFLKQISEDKYQNDAEKRLQSQNAQNTLQKSTKITDDIAKLNVSTAINTVVTASVTKVSDRSLSEKNSSNSAIQNFVEKGRNDSHTNINTNDKNIYTERWNVESKTVSAENKLTSTKQPDMSVNQKCFSPRNNSLDTTEYLTLKSYNYNFHHKNNDSSENNIVSDKKIKKRKQEEKSQESFLSETKKMKQEVRRKMSLSSEDKSSYMLAQTSAHKSKNNISYNNDDNVIRDTSIFTSYPEAGITSVFDANTINDTNILNENQSASTSRQICHVDPELSNEQVDLPLSIPVKIDINQIKMKSTNRQRNGSSGKSDIKHKALKKKLNYSNNFISPKKTRMKNETDATLDKNWTNNIEISDHEKSEDEEVKNNIIKMRENWKETKKYAENKKDTHTSSSKMRWSKKKKLMNIRKKLRRLFGDNISRSESEEEYEILLTRSQQGRQESIKSHCSKDESSVCLEKYDVTEETRNTSRRDGTLVDKTAVNDSQVDIKNIIPEKVENVKNPFAVINNDNIENIISKNTCKESSTIKTEKTEDITKQNEQTLLLALYRNLMKEIEITFQKLKILNRQRLQENQQLRNVENAVSGNKDIGINEDIKSELKLSTTSSVAQVFSDIEKKNDFDAISNCDTQQNAHDLLLISDDNTINKRKTVISDNASEIVSKQSSQQNLVCTEDFPIKIDESTKKLDSNVDNIQSSVDNASNNSNKIEIEIDSEPKSNSGCTKFSLKIPLSLTATRNVNSHENDLNIPSFEEFLHMISEIFAMCNKRNEKQEGGTLERSLDVNQYVSKNIEETSNIQQIENNSNLVNKDVKNHSLQQQMFKDDAILDNDNININTAKHTLAEEHIDSVEQETEQIPVQKENVESSNYNVLNSEKTENSSNSAEKINEQISITHAKIKVRSSADLNSQCCSTSLNLDKSDTKNNICSNSPATTQLTSGSSPANVNPTITFASSSINNHTSTTNLHTNLNNQEHMKNLIIKALKNIYIYLMNSRKFKYFKQKTDNEEQLRHFNHGLVFSMLHMSCELENFGRLLRIKDYQSLVNKVVSALNCHFLQNYPTSISEITMFTLACSSYSSYSTEKRIHEQQSSENVGNILFKPSASTSISNTNTYPHVPFSDISKQSSKNMNTPLPGIPYSGISNNNYPLQNMDNNLHTLLKDTPNIKNQQSSGNLGNMPYVSLSSATSDVNLYALELAIPRTIYESDRNTYHTTCNEYPISTPRATSKKTNNIVNAPIINMQQQSDSHRLSGLSLGIPNQRLSMTNQNIPFDPSINVCNVVQNHIMSQPTVTTSKITSGHARNNTAMGNVRPVNSSINLQMPTLHVSEQRPMQSCTMCSPNTCSIIHQQMRRTNTLQANVQLASNITPQYINTQANVIRQNLTLQQQNPILSQNLQYNVPRMSLSADTIARPVLSNSQSRYMQQSIPRKKSINFQKKVVNKNSRSNLQDMHPVSSAQNTSKNLSITTSETYILRETRTTQNISSNVPSANRITHKSHSALEAILAKTELSRNQIATDHFNLEFLTHIQKIILYDQIQQYFNIITKLRWNSLQSQETEQLSQEKNLLRSLCKHLKDFISYLLKQHVKLQDNKVESSSGVEIQFDKNTQNNPIRENLQEVITSPSDNTDSGISISTVSTPVSDDVLTELGNEKPFSTSTPKPAITDKSFSESIKLRKHSKNAKKMAPHRYSIRSLLNIEEISEDTFLQSSNIPEEKSITEAADKNIRTETQDIKINEISKPLVENSQKEKRSPSPQNTANSLRDPLADEKEEHSIVAESNINTKEQDIIKIKNVKENIKDKSSIIQDSKKDNMTVLQFSLCDRRNQDKEVNPNEIFDTSTLILSDNLIEIKEEFIDTLQKCDIPFKTDETLELISELGIKIDLHDFTSEQADCNIVAKKIDNETCVSPNKQKLAEELNSDSQQEQYNNISSSEKITSDIPDIDIPENISETVNVMKTESIEFIKHESIEFIDVHKLCLLEKNIKVKPVNLHRSSPVKACDAGKLNEQSPLKIETTQETSCKYLDKITTNRKEDTAQLNNIIKQHDNMEEEEEEIIICHDDIEIISEQFRDLSQLESDEKSQTSYTSVKESKHVNVNQAVPIKDHTFNTEHNQNMETEDLTAIPSILNVQSISSSLFEKMNNNDMSPLNDIEIVDVKEKERSSKNTNDNSIILDEIEDKACLRCKRKSTVCCENCLVAFYCSSRCSYLHWNADHYKHCKSHNNFKYDSSSF